MASEPVHLIERAAERLRGNAGLATIDAPPLSPPPQAAPPQAAPAPASPPPASPPPASPPPAGPLQVSAAQLSGTQTAAAQAGAEQARAPAPAPADVTMATLEQAGLVVGGKRARPTEEYRISASNVLRNMPQGSRGGTNLVMVTSTKPDEGKSFSALNLAASIALNGLAQVLLVDADPKEGSITSMLGLSDRPGLFDFANAGVAAAGEQMVVQTELAGLSIIPLGSNRSLLSEKGITQPVATAIERLGRKFNRHVVILDAPPCLSTSDPSMLAPVVDQIVMVIEAERTQREALTAALNLVKTCKSITLLLNKARIATTHSFGDYDYYGS